MFGKIKELMEAKGKMEEVKKRLESMTVEGESYQGEVMVTATGGRKITKIDINQGVLNVRGKLEIENLVLVAVNNALEKADRIMADEMKHVMPTIPGLGL
ncbi:MAG: YbaB/EbfC family nucleoid-associated protein [Bacteroidia bacterium]